MRSLLLRERSETHTECVRPSSKYSKYGPLQRKYRKAGFRKPLDTDAMQGIPI